MNSVTRPVDRPHRVRYHERAVTYLWDLTDVHRAEADDQRATIQAVLTIAWRQTLHRYDVTVHHRTVWTEHGVEHHARNPHATTVLATKTAGRFGVQTLRRYAFSTLMSLTDAQHPYFRLDAVTVQDDLLAPAC